MAPPSGVVDGNPRWFEIGQMTSDPGIERTDFGIPVNCAGAMPGVYCAQGTGLDYNFRLYSLTGVLLGDALWNPVNGQWSVQDLLGEFRGYALCYNYGTVDAPEWYISVITDLWTGTAGQFKPYPLTSLGPIMLFQSITTEIGPAVGSLQQYP